MSRCDIRQLMPPGYLEKGTDVKAKEEDKNKFKITELWAFVADDEGGEGLVAEQLNGLWMPYVCSDAARVKSLLDRARHIQNETGKKVKLMHFKLDDVQENI